MEHIKDEEIIELINKGYIQKEIAEELGVSDTVISERISKMRKEGIDIPKKRINRLDSEILRRLKNGEEVTKIAESLDINKYTVYNRIKKMKEIGVNVPFKKSGKRNRIKTKTKTKELEEKILYYLGEGNTQTKTAEILGVTVQTVARRIKDMRARGIEIPDYFAIRVQKRELTDVDEKIIEFIKKGYTQKMMAEELGIPRSTVMYKIYVMNKMGIDKTLLKRKSVNDFSTYDQEIYRLLGEGTTYEKIQEELGISQKVLAFRIKTMRENGIEIPDSAYIRKTKKGLDGIDKMILELMENGDVQNQTDIAHKLNLTQPQISFRIRKMRKMGIEIPDYRMKTIPKVTKEEVAKGILKLAETKGATVDQMREIAKLYGVEENVDALLKEIEKEKSGETR